MIDASTQSVLLLFFVNLFLLIIILVSFELIRKCRGDQAKIKINKKVIQQLGLDEHNNELEALLLENPSTRITRIKTLRRISSPKGSREQPEVKKNQYDWLKLLYKMNDNEVKQICGTDVALYLCYLRYCSILFLIICICSCTALLPLYYILGDRDQQRVQSYLETFTLINVQGRYSMVWVVFFFTVVYSMFGHLMIYSFEEQRKQLQVETLNAEASEMTDVDISMHSVLLRGIAKDIPLSETKEILTTILMNDKQPQQEDDPELDGYTIIPTDVSHKLLHIHVVGDYLRMLHYLQKLNTNQKKKEFFERLFKEKGKKVYKEFGSLCWKRQGAPLKDYYAQRPVFIRKQIEREKRKTADTNFGAVFITFASPDAAQKFTKHLKEIKRDLKAKNKSLYYRLDAPEWTLETAPCPSDIIWENFNKKNPFRGCRVLLLNIFLFFFTCILLNPNMFFAYLQPYLDGKTASANSLELLVINSIQPLIIFTYNYVFIPTLVDWVSYFEEIENKSLRHKNNLYKQFFFIMINTVFIPITQQKNIETFLKFMMGKDFNDFQLELSENFLKSSEFFLRYLIQITFLTNIVQILDIPHYLYMWMKRLTHKSYYEEEVEDDWYFDIGYHYAFAISVFIIVLIFSASVPLIPFFGFLFFTFKYFIDKYNFVFVYPSEFESRGILAGSVTKYTAFGLFLFQLSMCGLFTSIFGKDFVISSIILVIGEILYMIVFRFFNTTELRETFREILLEQGYTDENEWEPKLQLLKTTTKKLEGEQHLTDKHQLLLKEAYLHPYEKYYKQENAKRQLNILLKKEIKQRTDKVNQDQLNAAINTFGNDELESMLDLEFNGSRPPSLQYLKRKTSRRRTKHFDKQERGKFAALKMREIKENHEDGEDEDRLHTDE